MSKHVGAESSASLVVIEQPYQAVQVVILNRPEKRNALSTALLAALSRALDQAARDAGVRCAVLAARGPAFSAGADIGEMAEGGLDVLQNPQRARSWSGIERFPKPLIAAVEGPALGAGNELVLLADIVVAGESARFGQPEVCVGGMPGDGGTQRLVHAIGKNLAMKMLLTGRPLDAHAALESGLVAEVVATGEALTRAIALAREVAAAAPLAAQAVKQCVLHAFDHGLSAGLAFERQTMWRLAATKDRAEGLAAFLEKRSPKFVGE